MKPHSSLLLVALALTSCSKVVPVAPDAVSPPQTAGIVSRTPATPTSARTAPGRPGYEPAYVDGGQVTINAILTPSPAPGQAQADFYLVVYPIGWENLGIGTPQCNPCDHFGDGIDFTDFHDHILDSQPGPLAGGEFSALWHVFEVVPAYNGEAGHDAAVTAAYAGFIPTRSESAVNALLAAKLPDGSPVANRIDANFYFICSVVSANAAL